MKTRMLLLLVAATSCGRLRYDPLDMDSSVVDQAAERPTTETASDGTASDTTSETTSFDAALETSSLDAPTDAPTDAPATLDALDTPVPSPDRVAPDAPNTDSAPVDAPRGGCLPWAPGFRFSTPVPLTALNTSSVELEPILSADGLTLTFSSNRTGNFDLYVSTRPSRSVSFGAPTPVSEFNTSISDLRAIVFNGGRSVVMNTDRPGGVGAADVWFGSRATLSSPWDLRVLRELSTSRDEYDPFVTDDERELYFIMTMRPGGAADFDIVVSTITGSTFSPPQSVAGVNSTRNDANPAVFDARRLLLLDSERDEGAGSQDIYFATRSTTTATFSTPRALPGVNTRDAESEAVLTADGCELVFARSDGQPDLYLSQYLPP